MKRLLPFIICVVLAGFVYIGVNRATRQQAYREKETRVIAANADLNYSISRVKKDFDSIEEVAAVVKGKSREVAELHDKYNESSENTKALQNFSSVLKQEFATVKGDLTLKPLDKAVLLDELKKVQSDVDEQIQRAKFKEKCVAEADSVR